MAITMMMMMMMMMMMIIKIKIVMSEAVILALHNILLTLTF